jgi:hypothetical protein
MSEQAVEQEEFLIASEEEANAVLEEFARVDQTLQRLKRQYDKRTLELQEEYRQLTQKYGDALTSWARREMRERGGGKKTVTLLSGSVKFVKRAASLTLKDTDSALIYAVEKGDNSLLRVNMAKYLSEAKTHQRIYGSLLPGCAETPEQETVSFSFPRLARMGIEDFEDMEDISPEQIEEEE